MKIGRSVLYYWSPKFFCAIIRPQEVMIMAMCYDCYCDLERLWDDKWQCPNCGHIYYLDEDKDEIIDDEEEEEGDYEEEFPEEFYDSL